MMTEHYSKKRYNVDMENDDIMGNSDDERLEYYLSIGVVELEGVDESGEIIYSINESAKELAPELWESHEQHIDKSLIDLYNKDLLSVEYDENLEATFILSPEGKALAKEYGLIELFDKEIPND
jgi:hypothetical protein